MRTTPRSEADAKKASQRRLLKPGWYGARISEAVEKPSKRGNDMIELVIMVPDGEGEERTFRDWLTNNSLGALKLRHAAASVDALKKYEAGEIEQSDFPGRDVQVKITTEKRRGFPERNVIEDYAVAGVEVVKLRA